MGIKKTLGGDRVGSGKKMTVELENFGRSTHDQGKLIKTDQAAGTLVPYYCNIGLPGATAYIDLSVLTRTLPTVGPVFGSFKHQMEVYTAPIRLYIAALHNNALGIGLKMENMKLPIMVARVNRPNYSKNDLNSQQISQDSLLAYLGIRGLGNPVTPGGVIARRFPALFLLMYWDVYKNYYANKQEEIGYVITKSIGVWTQITVYDTSNVQINAAIKNTNIWEETQPIPKNGYIVVQYQNEIDDIQAREIEIMSGNTPISVKNPEEWEVVPYGNLLNPNKFWKYIYKGANAISLQEGNKAVLITRNSIAMTSFPLANIDKMREEILAAPKTTPFLLGNSVAGGAYPYLASYNPVDVEESDPKGIESWYSQVGLGIKTYLSDRFNNWLSTEWIDGVGGINEITAVDVSDGKLRMDALILSKKVFRMLNRIAISGGTYDDWQEAAYGVSGVSRAESPIYWGGMSSEIVFDEVVSNSATEDQPLGSLAGRGADRFSKGGNSIKVKFTEPSMLMIIGSITPRIDYSQGNKWWNMAETMNDWHKPDLDAIGFQELLTEEFAAFDTRVNGASITTYSVGKQPSWIEYMTEVNECYGSFANGGELSFMALNRSYEHENGTGKLKDGTTYIDPTKYNVAFADAKLSAKNFWIQAGIDVEFRRVMSAKQIPNL